MLGLMVMAFVRNETEREIERALFLIQTIETS